MDAKEVGAFIAERRKELGLTQVRLAEQIHVTDKAVSRWERGIGLPDINNIETLADALDVSLLELMQAQRNESRDNNISAKVAEGLLMDTIQLSKDSNKLIIKSIGCIWIFIFVMIAVWMLCILISDWETVIFSVGSIITGLIAWGIPIWQVTIGQTSKTVILTVSSFGFALLALMIQFFDIAREIYTGDIAAIIDTIEVLVMVVSLFSFITLLLNFIMIKSSK